MSQEKFKTMIGGQALIEGIMMRGPKKDAIVTCSNGELHTEVTDRKLPPKGIARVPFIRGTVNFFDAQLTGVKALMRSASLAPEEYQEEPSKFDAWLEKKLGSDGMEKAVVGIGVTLGLCLSIALFFVLPMVIGGFFYSVVQNNLLINLIEGLVRMIIFGGYMLLVSRMNEMKRVFAYHGAEHKTIRCYEAGLPLTVENVKAQTRLHPRCGTSFLLVVMLLSILVFSVASSGLLAVFPVLETIHGSFLYRFIMIVFKLLLLPLVVAISYEINRWVGRHDNWFTRILTAPGLWFQNFTTNEPDEDMIRTGIAALEAVLPENEGEDRW
jgi:uncharacterized protein YqhQ